MSRDTCQQCLGTSHAWFTRYTNPQKGLVQAVRELILNADDRVAETIKWQAPTFMYKGNIASFYPKATKHVSH